MMLGGVAEVWAASAGETPISIAAPVSEIIKATTPANGRNLIFSLPAIRREKGYSIGAALTRSPTRALEHGGRRSYHYVRVRPVGSVDQAYWPSIDSTSGSGPTVSGRVRTCRGGHHGDPGRATRGF